MDNEIISIDKLMECDFHIGRNRSLWNPKMKNFIWDTQDSVHILDLKKSYFFLEKSYNFLLDLAGTGGTVLFVSVKNDGISKIVEQAASRVNAFHVTNKWLGGLLTNFKQVSMTINKFNNLNSLLEDPEKRQGYTKKELLMFSRESKKLQDTYGGIAELQAPPNAIVVFNPVEDSIAVKEAKKMNIPVIAICNSDSNASIIDFLIPGNNLSKKSIYVIANILCDAIAEVQSQPKMIAHQPNFQVPEEYTIKQGDVEERMESNI